MDPRVFVSSLFLACLSVCAVFLSDVTTTQIASQFSCLLLARSLWPLLKVGKGFSLKGGVDFLSYACAVFTYYKTKANVFILNAGSITPGMKVNL